MKEGEDVLVTGVIAPEIAVSISPPEVTDPVLSYTTPDETITVDGTVE